MPKNLLIIFIKNPILGKVKTRLAATLGDEKALEVYNILIQHTHKISSELNYTKAVWYSDFIDKADLWENEKFLKFKQEGKTLGERMEKAFRQGFEEGFLNICIIGSDCFQLSSSHLKSAFEILQNNQVVIGPSSDGGYYLLGMNHLYSGLFLNKKWSTPEVLKETLTDLKLLNIKFDLLKTLTDVDEEKDLKTIDLNF